MMAAYEFGGIVSLIVVWIFIAYCVWFFVRRKTLISIIVGLLFGLFLANTSGFFALFFCLIFYLYDYYQEKKSKYNN